MFKHPKFSRLFFFITVALFVLLLGETGLAANSSKITFQKDEFDFGQSKEGSSLTHTFKFENTGDDVLKIANVQTSCGCAAALVTKKSYKPGEKGEIKVTFNTRGYEGEVSKYIYIESNDPDQPNKMLTVKASINTPPRPKIELDQYSVDLGLLLEGEGIETEAGIKNRGERELTVDLGHRDAEFFQQGKKINGTLKIAPGKTVQIKISIPDVERSGLIREYILLRSNDPIRPNLSLYISGYVVTKPQLKVLFDKYKNVIR
ncbi:MAG: DUF1573 domain-containing protein [Candidatus Aminicenantes bacterium]|nr:DUF1573 domain-containing protein [Candidatus Aminicenantes bacterium]